MTDAVTWIKGLVASIISAVSTAVLATGISSSAGNSMNWGQIGSIAASAAVVGACLYLKQSPVPADNDPAKVVEIPFRNSLPQPSAPKPLTDQIDK